MLTAVATAHGAEKLSYNRDIRPILSDNCFFCHGPDEKHREADLRLDEREGAVEATAIVPGKSMESAVWKRITSDDLDTIMPPPKTKKHLTPEQIALLKRWIDEGAEYEGHWAFQPIGNPKPPEVKQTAWVKNDIDRFILAELEKRGIAPSPEADRPTLLRRVSLDLTGLPPTPEEVQAFVDEARPDAFEGAVDRLLQSPHYAERWARHWLDQARYADSNGYSIDGERTMWPYRDWVIRAIGEDMPFSQFTIEQTAGDLLPNPTKLQLIATGFHRNTMINEEGGTDAEQFRNELVGDRINTAGSVWLALTLGCAQCHTHKFDPITHREYYELFAFFNQNTDANSRGETIDVLPGDVLGVPSPDAVAGKTAEEAKKRLEQLQRDAEKRRAAWEKSVAEAASETTSPWLPLKIDRYSAASNRTLRQLDDGSILAMKEGAPNDTYEIAADLDVKELSAIRLEVLPHESLPNGGAGTAGNGNFVLTEIEANLDGKQLSFANALADHQKKDYDVVDAIDDVKKTGWALEMGAGGKGPHEAWFFFSKPINVTGGKLTLKLAHDINDHYLIGRFRLSIAESMPLSHPNAARWEKVVAGVKKPHAERTKEETAELDRTFAEFDYELTLAEREAERTAKGAVKSTSLMVMKDLVKPRPNHILLRGDFLNPDKKTGPLTPDTPDCLPPLNSQHSPPNRLDFARWLVRDDHPLTPRVTVNRVWMRYFSQGLADTDADFGMQGSPPSHPELLDWLSRRFISDGWSMKKLHRVIVTSATYRQASHDRPELRERDPLNRMLARQNRVRVDAEIVRDLALAASGLLNRSIGGPSVRPPQPEGVYAFTQNKKNWVVAQGPDRYRRAMYTMFYRSAPHPLFTTFDAPNFSTSCTRRERSNTPLQSLTLANDEAFLECAGALAVRLWNETPDPSATGDVARLSRAFAICFGRSPNDREKTALLEYLQRERTRLQADVVAARDSAPKVRPPQLSEADAAAWAAVARVLLNTDEFITRE